MRTFKKVTEPAREITQVDKTVCDLCGRETKGENWEKSNWSINSETTVSCITHAKHTETYGWGDGGTGTEIIVDLCPWCFRDKLIPWLRSQGANIEVRDIDW